MKQDFFEFMGHNGTVLPGYLWQPDGPVKGVLQITHGMTEHIGRYEALAEYLSEQGIAVAGFDLRGHGKNPGDDQIASCGEGGWAASLEDMRLFFGLLQERFPGAPHFMLGFSLGSFLLREYLVKYPQGIAGALILGTGHQPGWLLWILTAMVNRQIKKVGFDGTAGLVRQLSFGTYNQRFRPNRTRADWLCADEAELDQYLADPLVRKDISAGLFRELLGSMKRTGHVAPYRRWNKELPVCLMHGTKDAVGSFGKGVQQVYRRMKKAGLSNMELKPYDGRHDILHEERSCAESVRQDIAHWLIKNII